MPRVEITNTARGPRGVNTLAGLVMLDPGATETVEMVDAELADLPSHFRTLGQSRFDAMTVDAKPDLSKMTVGELRALAKDRDIELPEKGTGGDGRVIKDDIVAAIEAGPKAAQGDALDAMTDDELRATVQALTGDEPPADADRAALLAIARG